jgi:predicted ATP-dependent Lon-type protease
VFENRVLRRLFGQKKDKVIEGWRKLHKEVLHNMYSSPDITMIIKSRRMRWAGYVAQIVEMIHAYRIFTGKHEEKRQLGRPRRR